MADHSYMKIAIEYSRECRDTANTQIVVAVNTANLNQGLVCKNHFYKCGQNNEREIYDVDVKSKYFKKLSLFEPKDIVEKTS